MIRLRPHLRLFRSSGGRWLEAVIAERAVPLDDVLYLVVRALGEGPVDTSAGVFARIAARADAAMPERGAVNAALSILRGLDLLDLTPGDASAASSSAASSSAASSSELWSRLAVGTPELPVIDQVELTNVCPMSCVMCPTGTGRMTRPQAFMDAALFDRVVDEAAAGPRTKPLTLHNLGESLLHPELARFVALATARGLQTELAGNPGHLPFDRYLALEEAGLTRLVLDVDGTDAETLEAIRGKGARGDRAFRNLDAVLDHRRRHPRPQPQLVLQMIRQQRNAHQHDAFLAAWADTGIDGVEAYLKEVDANTVETTSTGGLPIFTERPRRPYLCRAPWRSVVVLVDGSVVPCCHDDNAGVVYGNLRTQSLRDIWAGPVVAALRERLARAALDDDEPCARCAHRADRYPLPFIPALDDLPVEPLHW